MTSFDICRQNEGNSRFSRLSQPLAPTEAWYRKQLWKQLWKQQYSHCSTSELLQKRSWTAWSDAGVSSCLSLWISEVSLLQGLTVLAGMSWRHEETEEAWNRLHVGATCFAFVALINHSVWQKHCKKVARREFLTKSLRAPAHRELKSLPLLNNQPMF